MLQCSKYNSQNDLIYLITILFYQLCKERLMGKYYLKGEKIHSSGEKIAGKIIKISFEVDLIIMRFT